METLKYLRIQVYNILSAFEVLLLKKSKMSITLPKLYSLIEMVIV